MPALFTSTSQYPTRRATSSHDLGSETSNRTNSPLISLATCFPSFSFKSPTKTFAPAAANTRAIASPMPEAAPVTTAALFVSLNTSPMISESNGGLILRLQYRHERLLRDVHRPHPLHALLSLFLLLQQLPLARHVPAVALGRDVLPD